MQLNFIVIFGILVALMPFITIPVSIKTPLYVLLGLSISYLYHREKQGRKKVLSTQVQKKVKRPVGPITPINGEIKVSENAPEILHKER